MASPVRVNGVFFTFTPEADPVSLDLVKDYFNSLKKKGDAFLKPIVYIDIPAIRVSISNWRTTQEYVKIAWKAIRRVIEEYI